MLAEVVPSRTDTTKFTVRLTQGVQQFRLDYTGSEQQCEWYASMFRIALEKAHKEKTSVNIKRARKNVQQ